MLNIRWWHGVSNVEILQMIGLPVIGDILRQLDTSLFGHVTHLGPGQVCRCETLF